MRAAALLLLAAVLQDPAPDPAAAFAAALSDPDGWELKWIEAAKAAPDDYCDAKTVGRRELPDADRKVSGLYFGSLGKSSHACDGSTQVSKIVEVPGNVRLKLRVATAQWSSAPVPKLALRFANPGGTTFAGGWRLETPGKNNLDAPADREVLLLTAAPVKVRIVFDTTCRTASWFSSISAVTYCAEPLADAERRELLGLLDEFRSDEAAVRDSASEKLAGWLRRPGFELPVLALLRSERAKREDAESRARIDSAAASATWIADLSSLAPAK